nr:hypothetical protein [Tanacetum cinerariifolium]
MECIETLEKELETLKKDKEVVDGKLASLLTASNDLDNLIESQRSDKSKEGLGYTTIPHPVAQLYLSPKKDLSWTGLPECADDTVTDYSRPSPTVESSLKEDQHRNPSASKNVASPITPKQFVKFVKASDSQSKSKTDEKETPEKPPVKNAKQYRKPNKKPNGSSHNHIDDKGYWDSGCSRHMTGNMSYLSDYEPFDGEYVFFRQGGCKITKKGTIKNVLGRDFKLLDDANILLRTPRQHNMYSIDLNNTVLHRHLTCLVAKAPADECNLWHRRLGHLNFKTMNKLVRHNLVRGLHTKCFENDHNCTACLKGKQHKTSCKSKLVTSVSKPLHTLHMDLFGPTSVSSISHKWYCLVVTDDFSRFTWTFFLRTKDETSSILMKFITEIENLKDLRVKIIRCDNGGEFRNKELNDFCSQKGIKREFSNARTPQQNGVAERRNRVLVNKTHNKTPYELFNGRTPAIGFLKPFGCHVMILNTLDNLGKFKAKRDEGYFLGYSMSSKAFRIFNKRTNRVEKNVHIEFVENKAIEKGSGPNWLFDIDSLTQSMNYVLVVDAGIHSTSFSGTKVNASKDVKKDVSSLRYIVLPNWVHEEHLESTSSQPQDSRNTDAPESSGNSNPTATSTNPLANQLETLTVETPIPTVSLLVPTVCFTDSQEPSSETRLISKKVTNQEETPSLDNILTLTNQFEDILGVTSNSEESNGVEADEERIDYNEVFAPVARIEAIRLFLAYASFMGFTVYQMDVKSAFLYGTINEEVYVMQPPGFQDLKYPARVYKVEKAMYGLHQAPRAWYGTLSKYLLSNGFQRDVKSSNTPMDKENPWGKDVKRIFRYLKGHPKLGLWYPKDSLFDLVAFSDSNYGGATQDHKSTSRGCQFLGRRLISWQCKKQTIVATSTTEAEYVAAASCYGFKITCLIMGTTL